jgi:hypothetical protein
MPYNIIPQHIREKLVQDVLLLNPNSTLLAISSATKLARSTAEKTKAWQNRKKLNLIPEDNQLCIMPELRQAVKGPENTLITQKVINKPTQNKVSIFVDSANIICTNSSSTPQDTKVWSEKLIALLKLYIQKHGSNCDIYYYVSVNHTLSGVYNELSEMGVKIIFTFTRVLNAFAPDQDHKNWQINYSGNCDEYIIADMPLISMQSSEVILLSNDCDYHRVIKNIINSQSCSNCKVKVVHTQILHQAWDKLGKNDNLLFVDFADEQSELANE